MSFAEIADDEQELINYRTDEYAARVVLTPSACYVEWTDYVANLWREDFARLSTALARLAALAACEDSTPDDPWSRGFVHGAEAFTDVADSFFDEVIR